MNDHDPDSPRNSRELEDSTSGYDVSRRAAIGAGLGIAFGVLSRSPASAAIRSAIDFRQTRQNPYVPFRMGIQSYSLRGFDLDQALEKTKGLGLTYWEAFQAHVGMTSDAAALAPTLAKIKAAGVELKVWGVQGFSGDEAACRKIFDFAKLARLETISADPSPETLPILDKLTQEYKINIAIHNHGPGSRYDKLDSVLNAVKNLNVRVGACVDTGHTLRSKEDPVEWVEKLGDRVHDLHLKDVKNATEWRVLGQGDLRLKDLLSFLKKRRYSGLMMLEYEQKPENPIADIEACLSAVRSTLKEIS